MITPLACSQTSTHLRGFDSGAVSHDTTPKNDSFFMTQATRLAEPKVLCSDSRPVTDLQRLPRRPAMLLTSGLTASALFNENTEASCATGIASSRV
jgi:hypothetical protein